ncbi:FAD-binding oxidoreductase [Rhodobacteraceae bacterium CCMM004]|nr:FAD-binding oxidoreductase [Rhodobacteraceae bacterium CCMM004]
MDLIDRLRHIVGDAHVLTGAAADRYGRDWTGKYEGRPLAAVRPADTSQTAKVMRLAHETGTPVVPMAGNTGLMGGAHAPGQLVLSIERLNAVREVRPAARIAIVEAGCILSDLHAAAEAHDLVFPLTFGARGSARIGGALSTNAGGSNVLRYGNTRALTLGIEVVLPTGEVLDLMSALHKDNSGYDLKDLFIGAEGTLGVITAAVVKLAPKPRAYATAMVALPSVADALTLLNRLQEATGGAVEAFEYMPGHYIDAHLAHVDGARPPFAERHEVNVMVEVGATAPRDATPSDDGSLPIVGYLEDVLAEMIEAGTVTDATVAQNEAQRREIWARREVAGELCVTRKPAILTDVSVPTDRVPDFLARASQAVAARDPDCAEFVVSHLGDGNVHLTLWPSRDDEAHLDALMETVEDVTQGLGGSFSAEHGIGLGKRASMARRKDPVALDVMRRIKAALDPGGIMNPGKVLP